MKKYLALAVLCVASMGSQIMAYSCSFNNHTDQDILVYIKTKKSSTIYSKTIAPQETGTFQIPEKECLKAIRYLVDPKNNPNKEEREAKINVGSVCNECEIAMYNVATTGAKSDEIAFNGRFVSSITVMDGKEMKAYSDI